MRRNSEAEQFERSREYYKSNLPDLVAEYEGEHIVIIDDKMVDSAAEFSDLAERVYRQCGYRDIYMPRVQREAGMVQVRSPRIVSAAES